MQDRCISNKHSRYQKSLLLLLHTYIPHGVNSISDNTKYTPYIVYVLMDELEKTKSTLDGLKGEILDLWFKVNVHYKMLG